MDAQSQIKITVKEIQEILPKLSGPEILELDRKIHEYLDTMTYSRAAETAFSEWNDPEEAIYDET
jgi:glutaredoxin 2